MLVFIPRLKLPHQSAGEKVLKVAWKEVAVGGPSAAEMVEEMAVVLLQVLGLADCSLL